MVSFFRFVHVTFGLQIVFVFFFIMTLLFYYFHPSMICLIPSRRSPLVIFFNHSGSPSKLNPVIISLISPTESTISACFVLYFLC